MIRFTGRRIQASEGVQFQFHPLHVASILPFTNFLTAEVQKGPTKSGTARILQLKFQILLALFELLQF